MCNFRNKDIILQNQPKAGLYKNNDKEGKSHLSRAKSLQKSQILHLKSKIYIFSGYFFPDESKIRSVKCIQT